MTNILIFTALTIVNVTLSTIRSLCTIKGGKWVSAITNALCYGFYPLIVALTAKDMVTIVANMVITGVVNFVCVWIIKLVEEKTAKEKLWKVEMAIPKTMETPYSIKMQLHEQGIEHNYVEVGEWNMFNCYCINKADTAKVIQMAKEYRGKYSAYESKI